MAIHPVGIKNTFLSHFVFWAFFLPLLTVIFVPFFMPDQNIDEAEVKMVRSFNIDLPALNDSVNSTFSKAFIGTGLMQKTESFFDGHSSQVAQQQQGKTATAWIRGVWLMIYKLIWRVYALARIFFLPLLVICIPAAIDGAIVRARKKYRFETSNPIFFYSSTHTVTLVSGLFVFLPLAPITLSSGVLAALMVALALAVWIAASNFQQGV